jgi:hypothetical protein
VFIARDDEGPKARVPSFIESMALRSLDVGGLKMAHWLQGAGLLMVAPLSAKPLTTTTSGLASTHPAEGTFLTSLEGHWLPDAGPMTRPLPARGGLGEVSRLGDSAMACSSKLRLRRDHLVCGSCRHASATGR